MQVLVAGGAGFIGVNLVRALLSRGDHVVVLDDFSTGWPALDVAAYTLGTDENLAFIQTDVAQPKTDFWPDRTYDAIINLACPASPIHYQKNRIKTLRTSVVGTLRLLELAQAQKAVFVQASTSEIYGDPDVHPQPESYRGNVNPIGPRACYDEGKRAAETLCFDFLRDRGVNVRVARIFNTYGPMMHPDDGRLVSEFICRAIKGEPLTINGSGEQTRSLCYIDDLVQGLLRLLDITPAVIPINLGNPEEFTVNQVAELVLAATGSISTIVHAPLPTDDPRKRQPDIYYARSHLGWAPLVPFRDGLERTIRYFIGRQA